MSLISDALKKARQEAARQDSLRQGVPYALGVAEPAGRRDPWISLLAGLGAGCILAAVVFSLAYFAGWGPFHKPAAAARIAVAVPPAAPKLPQPGPAPEAVPAMPISEPPAVPPPVPVAAKPAAVAPPPAPVAKPDIRIERPAPKAAPPAAAPEPAPVEERPAPVPAAVVPPSVAPAPAPSPLSAAASTGDSGVLSGVLEDGKVYAGEVPVPGGGSVKLNGIAFSQDHPVAVLDGRVMGPGESVGGFTIVAIESGRVKLQGHGATVFLSPK